MTIEQIAEALWDIIDEIDTCSDIAKNDHQLYRALVENLQKDRFKYGTVDNEGANIEFHVK